MNKSMVMAGLAALFCASAQAELETDASKSSHADVHNKVAINIEYYKNCLRIKISGGADNESAHALCQHHLREENNPDRYWNAPHLSPMAKNKSNPDVRAQTKNPAPESNALLVSPSSEGAGIAND